MFSPCVEVPPVFLFLAGTTTYSTGPLPAVVLSDWEQSRYQAGSWAGTTGRPIFHLPTSLPPHFELGRTPAPVGPCCAAAPRPHMVRLHMGHARSLRARHALRSTPSILSPLVEQGVARSLVDYARASLPGCYAARSRLRQAGPVRPLPSPIPRSTTQLTQASFLCLFLCCFYTSSITSPEGGSTGPKHVSCIFFCVVLCAKGSTASTSGSTGLGSKSDRFPAQQPYFYAPYLYLSPTSVEVNISHLFSLLYC
jgi:hypothetical protein